MTPGFVHLHKFRGDLFFRKEHFEHLEMPVGDCLEDILTKPITEFHDPLLVTRWAEMPTLARESQ